MRNGIGEYGIRQLSKFYWHNLAELYLGTMKINEMAIKLETQDANG